MLSRKAHIMLAQLNQMTRLDEVLQLAIRVAMSETSADRGSLLVMNERGSVTHKVLARPGQLPEVAQINVHLVMTEGLGGWVCRNQQNALITDTTRDARWVELPDDDWETGAVIAVFVPYGERILGLLTLQHEERNAFNSSHLNAAKELADLLAEPLEAARLHERAAMESG
ncbi:GAF domain-containing protein [Magnetofaba australis]|uniref:Putative sensor protein n=1 Tax=Magnetofaba australis IT-1 TaxID=1434232 RepID=A0A1Y2K1L7_9PROT|nr:GAF domain-containing protein [Magnetofaba australis]OSM00201.1 putative sensor protein [Magnetofaba australis IT-1]